MVEIFAGSFLTMLQAMRRLNLISPQVGASACGKSESIDLVEAQGVGRVVGAWGSEIKFRGFDAQVGHLPWCI